MSEAKRNYWVDAVMGIAFLVVALSALVFLVPSSWIDFSSSTTPTVLGIDFGVWQTMHKWAGIVMLIGIVVHQLLHWKWSVTMTKKVLPRPRLPKREQPESSQVTGDG
jgi:hypothetical protein